MPDLAVGNGLPCRDSRGHCSNLPVPLTTFVGRGPERDQILIHIAHLRSKIVCLHRIRTIIGEQVTILFHRRSAACGVSNNRVEAIVNLPLRAQDPCQPPGRSAMADSPYGGPDWGASGGAHRLPALGRLCEMAYYLRLESAQRSP